MTLTCVTAAYNVIAAGNREALIRCAESVAMLGVDHEHLIYDGGSADGTVELLRELESKTPGLKVVSEPDSGIYNALNKGVRDASGEWLVVLGADDYISHPDVLDRILSEEDESTQVIVALAEVNGKPSDFFIDRIHVSIPYCHQGVIAKTSLIRRLGGFDERYRIAADYDMMLKWHEAAVPIHFRREPFVYFSKGGFCQQAGEKLAKENNAITIAHYGVTVAEQKWLVRHGCIPLRVSEAHMGHKDPSLRQGAAYMRRYHYTCYVRDLLYPLILLRRKWMRWRLARGCD